MSSPWPCGTPDASLRDNLNNGVVRPIGEVTLAAGAASIDFASIAADWSHLMLVVYARTSGAVGSAELLARFNGDAGANYDHQRVSGVAGTASAAEALAATAATISLIPGASATGGVFGGCVAFVPHYANGTNQKLIAALAARKTGIASGDLAADARVGFWRNAAAITQVTFSASSGNLVTGTRISVYGMGGI